MNSRHTHHHHRSTPTLTIYKNQLDHSESSGESSSPKLSQLLRLIECPVCRELPQPPIHNCENGHFVCASCYPRLTTSPRSCPYCLGTFTRMRNYPLESLLTTPSVPCDFVKFGCNKGKLTLLEYESHMEWCWAQIWRPGKIIPHKQQQSSRMLLDDTTSTCPRCNQENSTRKVKCRKCDQILRPPTPMKEQEERFAF